MDTPHRDAPQTWGLYRYQILSAELATWPEGLVKVLQLPTSGMPLL